MSVKRLELVYPHDDQQTYEPGRNCDDIRPVSHGYSVILKTVSITFPHHRVATYTEDNRPGVIPEPLTEEDVPAYAQRDGAKWRCKVCQRGPFHNMHGLKVHWGSVHGGP